MDALQVNLVVLDVTDLSLKIFCRAEMLFLRFKSIFLSSLFSWESRVCKPTLDKFLGMLDIFGI